MNDMLTVIKALAPNTAAVQVVNDICIGVTGYWPGRAGLHTIQFTRRPDGAWVVIVLDPDGIAAASRRLQPFRPCDVLRLTRFFADPLRWFLKGVKS
jgi:hypothetical protein